ncbi:MAG: hypothetical protein AAF742_00460, partial [Pseudomonadota bacterium]
RMWLSLFALLSLLQFIWLREDSPVVIATATSITQASSEAGFVLPAGMTANQLSQQVYQTIYAIYPALALTALTLGGALFPFWGTNHTAATRIRSTFATLIPGALVSVLLLVFVVAVSPDQFLNLAFRSPLMVALISPFIELFFNFITAARGAFLASNAIVRIGRAIALAFWLGLINLGTSLAAQLVGSAIVDIQTGVPLFFRGG